MGSKQSKGGRARAAKLTPSECSAIAKKAADARWKNRASRTITGYEYEAFLLFEKLENARSAIRHAIPPTGDTMEWFTKRVAALDEVYEEYLRDRAFLRAEWGLD